MTASLWQRYTYGTLISPSDVQREIVTDAPRRQQRLIILAEQQIKTQKAMIERIAEGYVHASESVTNEIRQQTHALETSMDTLSTALWDAADHITTAVTSVGDRISGVLYELQWELAQQSESLRDILYVLRNSRNEEAQQLVRQGIRHYVNQEYTEAEDRFRRALEFDTTDYQVLMNLAYIEIHKGNSAEAFKCFEKAMRLPVALDRGSMSRTLWATARLHYAEERYEEALLCSEKALHYDGKKDPKGIFMSGVYAALAGRTSGALAKIEQAIELKPELFAVVATEPALDSIRVEVLARLAHMSDDLLGKTRHELDDIQERLACVSTERWLDSHAWVVAQANDACLRARQMLQNPSYSRCRMCLANIDILRHVMPHMVELDQLCTHLSSSQKAFAECRKRSTEMRGEPMLRARKSLVDDFEGVLILALIPTTYITVYCLLGKGYFLWPVMFLALGPMTLLDLLFGCIFHAFGIEPIVSKADAPAMHAGRVMTTFIVLSVLIGVSIYAVGESVSHSIQARIERLRSDVSEREAETTTVGDEIAKLETSIEDRVSEIRRSLANMRWDDRS